MDISYEIRSNAVKYIDRCPYTLASWSFVWDFKFHVDFPTDAHAMKLINRLESFGHK